MAATSLYTPAEPLRVARIASRPFDQNFYLVSREGFDRCVVVDPGMEPDAIAALVEAYGLRPEAILLTHGHSDHIAGNAALRERWPGLPIMVGRHDATKLTSPVENLSAAFGIGLVSPPADRLLDDGETLSLAGIDLAVRAIPGHSRGHVVFVAEGVVPPVVFGGDVLFREGVGRSDFPDGDFAALATGIRGRLYGLPDETVVFPGHGDPTTIGHEKRHNPFVPAGPAR